MLSIDTFWPPINPACVHALLRPSDAAHLSTDPGPRPIKLSRSELEQLGLAIRDDYQVPVNDEEEGGQLIASILTALSEALRLFEGPQKTWTRRDIRRAMTLIGGLEEKTAAEILDQEGA